MSKMQVVTLMSETDPASNFRLVWQNLVEDFLIPANNWQIEQCQVRPETKSDLNN